VFFTPASGGQAELAKLTACLPEAGKVRQDVCRSTFLRSLRFLFFFACLPQTGVKTFSFKIEYLH
jgi:hypothetical protein